MFKVGRSKKCTRKGSVKRSSEIQRLVSDENVAEGCPGQHGGGVTIGDYIPLYKRTLSQDRLDR